MKSYLTIVLLMVAASYSFAQEENERIEVETYIPTENTNPKSRWKPADLPKKKNYKLIYVPNTKGILYGNPCAYDETHKMGFEYIVEPRKSRLSLGNASKSKVGKFLNNLWVKSFLVTKRTPFWKTILNARLNKCKEKSGDFTG